MALRIKSITDCTDKQGKTVYVDVDKICSAYLSDGDSHYFWVVMSNGNNYLVSVDEYAFDAFITYWKG